jgi:hypothetical protein
MADNKKVLPIVCAGVYLVLLVAVILIGIVVLGHAPVPVGIFCVAEAALAACLSRTPVWVHTVVFVVQIALGFFAGAAIIMVCMGILYLAGVAALYIWRS